MSGPSPRDPFRNARLGDGPGLGDPRAAAPGTGDPAPGGATDPGQGPDPATVSALMRDLQAAADQLSGQLSGLAAAGREAAGARAEHLPVLHRLLELAPPELRQRVASAATNGLVVTRDLADWVLAQLSPPAARAEPQELSIMPLAPMIKPLATTWILTASVENHLATEATDFSVIGIKERNRKRALDIEPGDVIVLYLTKVMAFAGAIRITGDLFEDRTPIWPGQPKRPDPYPWRLPTEPIVALPREAWIPAESLHTELEHVQKWPAEHWKLAFQGQLRSVSEHDSALLLARLGAVAGRTP